MTAETQWLACETWLDMYKLLPADATRRKLRLFAVACCRRLPGLAELSLELLDVAERHAEGAFGQVPIYQDPLYVAYIKASGLVRAQENNPEGPRGHDAAQAVAWALVPVGVGPRECAAYAAYHAGRAVPGPDERRAQYRLLADVLLAHPSAADSPAWLSWNGGAVEGLARSIESEQAFERLPLLADALEDAGCTDAALLGHCRGPGPHARGCWALDLLLGMH